MKKILILFFLLSIQIRSLFSQALNWQPLPQTLNGIVNNLVAYNGSIVAVGNFTIAGGIPVNHIAAWNGSTWAPLGQGLTANFNLGIKLLVFNNELYACGRFDSAGTVASKNIAKWNGASWTSMATSCNGNIYSLGVYNNELCAGGSFTNINGVNANHIAKWTGSNWQALGTGVDGTNINDLCVYQNELYAVGVFTAAGGVPSNYIARWNGSNWNNVSVGVPYGNGGLIVWQNKLLIGANTNTTSPYPSEIHQWDGSNLTLFSQQQVASSRDFLIFNNKLYNGATPSIWNESTFLWDTMSTRVVQVYSLCDYNGELYCSGNFRISFGYNADYIAKWGTPVGLKELSDDNVFLSAFPNPVNSKLTLQFKDNAGSVTATISNVIGETLYGTIFTCNKEEIDLSNLANGVYFIKIESGKGQKTLKILKN